MLAGVLSLACAHGGHAAEPSWSKAQLLRALYDELQPVARRHGAPDCETVFRQDGADRFSLACGLAVQEVRVPRGKAAGMGYRVEHIRGPVAGGFRLQVWLADRDGGQALRPQAIDVDGRWTTHLGAPLPALGTLIMFNLDYGPEVDPGLMVDLSRPERWLELAVARAAKQPLAALHDRLRDGSAAEKQAVLEAFRREPRADLVPDVIAAVLDPTALPRDGDTGWATVHHLAATALGDYARALDGIDVEKRGLRDYTFYDEGGVGELTRRRAVHANWLRWWQARPNGERSRRAQ
jgi:hypothetical protein